MLRPAPLLAALFFIWFPADSWSGNNPLCDSLAVWQVSPDKGDQPVSGAEAI
jgi:hypothetical protein